MSQAKPRVIKDYDALEQSIQEQIKLVYPYGFSQNLISYTNKEGKLVSALPFETDDKYYLVRMTLSEARTIIDEDDDFDDDGMLKDDAKETYEDKYSDLDYLAENIADDSDSD